MKKISATWAKIRIVNKNRCHMKFRISKWDRELKFSDTHFKEGYLTASHKLRWMLKCLENMSDSWFFNAEYIVQSPETIILNVNSIGRVLGRISSVFSTDLHGTFQYLTSFDHDLNSFCLNHSGSRDHAVTKPIKNIRANAATCLLSKTSKIIQIGSRSSEICEFKARAEKNSRTSEAVREPSTIV